MKILNIVSDSPTRIPIIPKIFWTEISAMIEISINFDPHAIIEFQIYSFILPILQAILGKNLAKTLWYCYQYKFWAQSNFFEKFEYKLFGTSSSTHNQSRVPNLCLVRRQSHHTSLEYIEALSSHQYPPQYFGEAPAWNIVGSSVHGKLRHKHASSREWCDLCITERDSFAISAFEQNEAIFFRFPVTPRTKATEQQHNIILNQQTKGKNKTR